MVSDEGLGQCTRAVRWQMTHAVSTILQMPLILTLYMGTWRAQGHVGRLSVSDMYDFCIKDSEKIALLFRFIFSYLTSSAPISGHKNITQAHLLCDPTRPEYLFKNCS